MKFKFRPGDKVVCIDKKIKRVYPDTYTVKGPYFNGAKAIVDTEEQGAFVEDWLELEALVNSPLMKALE